MKQKNKKKIGYLAAILKQYNILNFVPRIMIFYSAYIYGANFITKFQWERGFLRGVHPSLDTNGSKSTLVT